MGGGGGGRPPPDYGLYQDREVIEDDNSSEILHTIERRGGHEYHLLLVSNSGIDL
jgi:hypothetical protein